MTDEQKQPVTPSTTPPQPTTPEQAPQPQVVYQQPQPAPQPQQYPQPQPQQYQQPQPQVVYQQSPEPQKPAKPPRLKAGSDLRYFMEQQTQRLGFIRGIFDGIFHYFFVGCVSLLILSALFIIPAIILALLCVVLLTPGYFFYDWFITPGNYFSPWLIIVTVFWTGYCTTHAWPRIRDAMGVMGRTFSPTWVWFKNLLTKLAEND